MIKCLCFFVLLGLIFPVSAYCQVTRLPGDVELLNGKIRQVTGVIYMPGYRTAPALMDTADFDAGDSTVTYSAKLRFHDSFKYKYVIVGKPAAEKMSVSSNQPGKTYSCKVDSNGNLVEYSTFLNGQLEHKQTYLYGSKRKLLKLTVLQQEDKIVLVQIFAYDHNGLLSNETDDMDKKQFDQKIFYHYEAYDKKGNWTKRTSKRKLAYGEIADYQTTERKITYW